MSFPELLAAYNVKMSDLTKRYNIPYRTLQEWNAGRREPPDYVLELLKFRLEHDIDNT